MTVYLMISLPKMPYINRTYMVLANPTHQLLNDMNMHVCTHTQAATQHTQAATQHTRCHTTHTSCHTTHTSCHTTHTSCHTTHTCSCSSTDRLASAGRRSGGMEMRRALIEATSSRAMGTTTISAPDSPAESRL